MPVSDDFIAAAEQVYDLLSVCGTYTDRDGIETSANLVIEYDLNQWGDVAEISGKTALISVRTSQVPLPPRPRETFSAFDPITRRQKTYIVDQVLLTDELEHRCLVV